MSGLQRKGVRMQGETNVDFTPLLTTVDWNDEWKKLQQFRHHRDDASFWDKRSATFTTKDAPNPYVERFLELACLMPGETVFDMGCGTGALAIPLAERGHKVVAADFSQGMLDRLREEMESHQVSSVFPKLMSWDEPWEPHGVREGMVDVCFASRSIAVDDMRDALLRLDRVARRRVCVTLSTGDSPRSDAKILRDVGITESGCSDCWYAVNILVQAGIMPEVSYIKSIRKDTFDSHQEAYETFVRMVDAPRPGVTEDMREEARGRLHDWLRLHTVPNPEAGKPDRKGVPQGAFCLDEPRVLTWAFIAWNK